jgi:hypothetical protein
MMPDSSTTLENRSDGNRPGSYLGMTSLIIPPVLFFASLLSLNPDGADLPGREQAKWDASARGGGDRNVAISGAVSGPLRTMEKWMV